MKYQLGPYRIDRESHVVWQGSVILRLPPKAVEFLLCLVERHGAVVMKEEIRARVWPDAFVEESSLAQIASLLRKALKPGFGGAEVIETVPRRGYRLAVTAVPADPAEAVLSVGPVPRASVEAPPLPPSPALGTRDAAEEPPFRARTRHIPWLVAGCILVGILASTLWILRDPPGPPMSVHPLTVASGEEDDADVSGDGTRVVYAWRPDGSSYYNLYVKLIGGAPSTRLTNVEADDRRPVWSPDHSMIAFSRVRQGSREIRVVSAIGGDDRLILGTSSTNPDLSWSPDGEWLAYSDSDPSGKQPGGILMISLQTSERRRLTSPVATYDDGLPRFSPDGRSLAFVRYIPVTEAHDIYVVSTSGGAPVRITRQRRGARGLAWSEDGREIVYASDLQGAGRLFRVRVSNGGDPQWIEAAGFGVYGPSVARRGRRMAFTLAYQDVNIWRVPGPGRPATAAQPEKLIASSRASHSQQYSQDGRRIAFISDRGGSTEVWVANADGSNPTPLTSFREPSSAGSPAWSPDGSHIAFDKGQSGDTTKVDIFVISSNGGKPTRFTTDLAVNRSPSWSQDGNWIYFSSSRSGVREIWRQPWRAGTAQQITHNGGYRPQESPDGKYVYYTKAEGADLWRTPVAGGLEEVVPECPELADKRYWVVTSRGYYWAARGDSPFPSILFFDLASRKTTALIRGDAPLAGPGPGIAVSPGDAWVLYPRRDRLVRRIMIAENFR